MKHSHADFDITIKKIENGNIYVIVCDLNKGRISVTNDMENVLLDLLDIIPKLKTAHIIYRDSNGNYDGIKQLENGFEFVHIGEKSESKAIEKVEFFENDY